MSMTAIEGEVRAYLAAVRAHLHDLHDDERDDLLEDLEQHLTEVRAEGEGTLIERLGPPDVYAAELKASAGIATEPASLLQRARTSLRSSRPTLAGLREFLPELRPGWWVLRGMIIVGALVVIMTHRDVGTYLRPTLSLERLIGLAFLIAGGWVSVGLARRALTNTRLRYLSTAATIGAVLLGLVAAQALYNTHQSYVGEVAAYEQQPQQIGYLAHGDGTPISNICAYDKHGKPLKNVMLFDQNGKPIIDLADPDNAVIDQTVMPPLKNAFPLKRKVIDPSTGKITTTRCPAVIVTTAP